MTKPTKNPPAKLTDKSKQFCIEYLVDFNASRAARDSGYSEATAGSIGHELLKKPEIQAFLKEQVKKQFEKTELSVEWVLSRLKEVCDRCLQRKMVMYFDKVDRQYKQAMAIVDDKELGIWEFDSAGANKSLELLGKYLKMYTDNINLGAQNSLASIMKELVEGKKKDAVQ